MKAIGASLGVLLSFFYLGCGSTEIAEAGTPNIVQVVPASFTVGTNGATVQISGTNFSSQSVVTWNGGVLPTTLLNSNTLSSPVETASLSTPGVAQLQVKNNLTGQQSQNYGVTISSNLAITTTSLPSDVVGTAYSTTLAATGGTTPYTWSVSSGKLPSGLSLAASTGIISGTPTAAGNTTFTVTVKDSAKKSAQTKSASFTLTVTPQPLAITTSTLASDTLGTAYSQTLAATGGTPSYNWAISSGSLPPGLSLSASSGTISGTPTSTGTFAFGVTASDKSSPVMTSTASFSITVKASAPAIGISTTSLTGGTTGVAYSQTLQATGGTPAYSWSITAGSLPAGLSLAASTGVISGTPTSSGTSSFTATVRDSGSPVQTKSVTLSIAITPTGLKITTSALSSAANGTSYIQGLQATGGTLAYRWSVASGSLPAGLALNSATGVISGTPTTSGTATFTANVSDSSSPAQTASVALSLAVTGGPVTPLAITTSTLAAGTTGGSYSQTLQASGGTPAYTWSITSGALPSGLSLASATGIISGTPTATGTSTFTATVTDSESPAQSKSATLSLAVSATPLSITSSALAAATSGSIYSQSLKASGGTPGYTWAVTSGSLPAGLTLAATTGVITGTPTTTGTATFTASVTDSSNPAQSVSATTSILVDAATTSGSTTWYIRPDGGTRYSSNTTSGQCDGKHDAPYPGSGTNQPCAFNDFRFMWDDQSYGNDAWVMAGGDTVIIEGCASNPNQPESYSPHCRIGFDNNTGAGAGYTWCVGGSGPYSCSNPTIPSGTPTAHTKIYGACAVTGTCNTGNSTNRSSLTVLYGGFGVGSVLNLSAAQYVDVQGLELTSHNQAVPGTNGICIGHGSPAYPAGCVTSFGPSMSDYDSNGITVNANTSNVTLTDLWIDGHTNAGIQGPIGSNVALKRVQVNFNGFAGWNFDDGADDPNGANASIAASYVTMIGNGCNQQWPITNPSYPAVSCYDLSSGGFGDSWSGQDSTLASFTCDHCVQAYNTKDGFIGPHTQITNLTITNSASYGNMGQQWKWGMLPNSTLTFENNYTVGNCMRMSQQLPGAPINYNISTGNPGAYLGLFCRAAGDIFSFYSAANSTVVFANNTIVGYSQTVFDMNCYQLGTCASTPYQYRNNVFLGFMNPNLNPTNPQLPNLYYLSDSSDSVSEDHNLYYNLRAGCPSTTGSVCASPLLTSQPPSTITSESQLDNFNIYPTATSPVVGAGAIISGLTTDLFGITRPIPPSIGAAEPQ